MLRVKNLLKGEQLKLPLEQVPQSDYEMVGFAEVRSVKFLKPGGNQDFPTFGIAIAASKRFVRVRYIEKDVVQESDLPRSRILSLDVHITAGPQQAEALHDQIAQLELERDHLRSEGFVAPKHCWIETGRVKGRNFRQAWWRSEVAMFDSKRSRGEKVKTCYIGEEGSPEHEEAKRAKHRRDRLKQIERNLEMLMEFENSQ